MADLNFDFSSYPKPQAQKSLIDQVQGLNQIDLQQQAIKQSKLDQANQALTHMVRAMGSLGPNASKEDYANAAQNAVDQGLVPQQQENIFLQRLQSAPDSKTFYKQFMSSAMDLQHQINLHTGINTDKSDNSINYQGKTDVLTGGFRPTTQSPIQLPPTTEGLDNRANLPNGQPNPDYLSKGPIGANGRPGFTRSLSNSVAPAAPALPDDMNSDPSQGNLTGRSAVKPRGLSGAVTGPTSPTVQRVDLEGTETKPATFNDRFGSSFPNRVVTGAAPGVAGAIQTVGEQSGKDYASALTRSRNFQADLYPAEAALKAIHELGPQAIGPGTDQLNDLKRALVTWLPNADPKTIENVSNFDQIKKYLTQVARTSGNTGTNDQLAAAFDANPNTKMSTAGVDTVLKSIIALRKMEHAQTLLFGEQGLPPNQFSQWVAKNQNVFDPRAFGFVDMDRKAQEKLIKNLSDSQRKKFEYSLEFAQRAGLIEPPKLKQ